MLRTEAMGKQCPFTTGYQTANPSTYIDQSRPFEAGMQLPEIYVHYCTTEQCMAWQYTDEAKTEGLCLRLMQ